MLIRLGRGLANGCRGGAVESSPYLDGVIASAVCDLDATCLDSYGGSGQTWSNLIASPADGAAQADYDFYLGADGSASTDDPTFTGTAGDTAAYFAMDGSNDFFTIKGGNTSFINAMHKTTGGSSWWVAFIGYIDSTAANGQGNIAGTTAGYSLGPGINIRHNTRTANRKMIASINGDTGADTFVGTDTLAEDSYYFAVMSFDAATGNLRSYLNTLTAETDTLSLNATTSDAGYALTIGNNGYNDHPYPKGRIIHFSMGNDSIDDSDAAAIIAHLETRHGRDYTP